VKYSEWLCRVFDPEMSIKTGEDDMRQKKMLTFGDQSDKEERDSKYLRLFAAIIKQAVEDYVSMCKECDGQWDSVKGTDPEWYIYQDEVRYPSDFTSCCHVIGVDPERTRQMITELVTEESDDPLTWQERRVYNARSTVTPEYSSRVEKRTYGEIASMFGMSETGVRKAYKRAVDKISKEEPC